MALSYDEYTKKIAVYLRRMMMASCHNEAQFFAGKLEAFIERNQHVVTREQQLRVFEDFQAKPLSPRAFERKILDKLGRPLWQAPHSKIPTGDYDRKFLEELKVRW